MCDERITRIHFLRRNRRDHDRDCRDYDLESVSASFEAFRPSGLPRRIDNFLESRRVTSEILGALPSRIDCLSSLPDGTGCI
jgi:hypothetical protein